MCGPFAFFALTPSRPVTSSFTTPRPIHPTSGARGVPGVGRRLSDRARHRRFVRRQAPCPVLPRHTRRRNPTRPARKFRRSTPGTPRTAAAAPRTITPPVHTKPARYARNTPDRGRSASNHRSTSSHKACPPRPEHPGPRPPTQHTRLFITEKAASAPQPPCSAQNRSPSGSPPPPCRPAGQGCATPSPCRGRPWATGWDR